MESKINITRRIKQVESHKYWEDKETPQLKGKEEASERVINEIEASKPSCT